MLIMILISGLWYKQTVDTAYDTDWVTHHTCDSYV